MGIEENNEVPEVTPSPAKLEDKRSQFIEAFSASHAVDLGEVTTDSKAEDSESESPSVIEDNSDSSSVKEEVKGGSKKSEEQVDKSTELLQNKEKALHEEREKRKQANLKLRELQRQYDEKLKEFESRLDEALNSKSKEFTEDTEKSPESAEVKELRRKMQAIESRQKTEELAAKQQKINDDVAATDKKLKEAGFPGFRFGAAKVDVMLRQLIDEGEYTPEDYTNPEIWAEVYKNKGIYEEVNAEFRPIQKKETMDSKIQKKKDASKAANYPGQRPEDVAKKEEDNTDTQEDYLAFRKKNAPKRTY